MLKFSSVAKSLDIRLVAFLGTGFIMSACSQGHYGSAGNGLAYQSHGSAAYYQDAEHVSRYAPQIPQYNMGLVQQPAFQNPAYSQITHTHDAGLSPVEIYPTGCGTVDLSSCGAHSGPSSDYPVEDYLVDDYNNPPKLRGRKKKNSYASIGAGSLDVDRNIYTGVVRTGIDGGYLGLELEAAKGFKSDNSTPITGTSQTLDLNYSVAGFGVVRLPLWDRFKALGRFGYHFSEFDQTLKTGSTVIVGKQKTSDLAYGGGIEFDVSYKDTLRLDYTGYETDFIGRTDSVTASYLRRF